MYFNKNKFVLSGILFFSLAVNAEQRVYAAQPLKFHHQAMPSLQAWLLASMQDKSKTTLKEMNRQVDFNQTLHIRVQQTYLGYTVWGADGVLHLPHAANTNLSLTEVAMLKDTKLSMHGRFYQHLETDLAKIPAHYFTQAKVQEVESFAIQMYQRHNINASTIQKQKNERIIFVDKNNKAHWAYKINFEVTPLDRSQTPAKPVYIINALTMQIDQHWDEIKTIDKTKSEAVLGGGFGGNKKMGQLIYDSLENNLKSLKMQRDATAGECYMQNKEVSVRENEDGSIVHFACQAVDPNHNHIYWDADFDTVNGGYSPANDALSAGIVIKQLYQDWCDVPVLKTKKGAAMVLKMIVHVPHYENAYWDGKQMVFGDGYKYFYPLTSLGVGAHEVSHGFTEQHSNLAYIGESGGMNEAFSDMAAQAAEFYAYGKNSWQIGPEIVKQANKALRYMDQPSKDCEGQKPGDDCSIDDASQYYEGLDVHYSSGVYNRFFYQLATTPGWDVKKAFEVMVQANTNYWGSASVFDSAACGVIESTKDLALKYPKQHFDVAAIQHAFDVVKVDYSHC